MLKRPQLITNCANGIQREIKVKRQKLGTVTSFIYLGALVLDDDFKSEILSRIAQVTAALTKLKPFLTDNNCLLDQDETDAHSFHSIFLFACEPWTLTIELVKREQAFEMRCYSRLLNILYNDHINN